MRFPVAVLALAVLAGSPATASGPELVLRPAGLTLRHVPPVLSEEMVARHLGTGLTTSFLFGVDTGRGRSAKGAAQVRIRYDLWDERYVLERWDARAESPAPVMLAKARLGEWWRALELLVATRIPAVRSSRAKVTLTVLPFSQAEQRDAQDWLLRSFQAPAASRQEERPGSSSAAEAAPLRDLYGSMLAASIGQRTLITYSWTVAVTSESR